MTAIIHTHRRAHKHTHTHTHTHTKCNSYCSLKYLVRKMPVVPEGVECNFNLNADDIKKLTAEIVETSKGIYDEIGILKTEDVNLENVLMVCFLFVLFIIFYFVFFLFTIETHCGDLVSMHIGHSYSTYTAFQPILTLYAIFYHGIHREISKIFTPLLFLHLTAYILNRCPLI